MADHDAGYEPKPSPSRSRLRASSSLVQDKERAARAGIKPRPRVHKVQPPRQALHFEFISPEARKVCLAGSFNNWKPEAGEMICVGNGRWVKDLLLTPGTYEYRLVIDGSWMDDPNADHAVMNPFGERNSLLTVSAKKKRRFRN